MSELKAIETEYRGYRFRSRLEARWAVFFDVCKVKWEYEPEGYDLGDGLYYLPDFLLHDVDGRDGGDIYVEVKGKMTDRDAEKINRFVELGKKDPLSIEKSRTATLVVGEIPRGCDMDEITNFIGWNAYNAYPKEKYWWPNPYNFESIDGDYFAAHPGINHEGRFELFGDDSTYLADMDRRATERAWRIARQARFEHGETPGRRRSR